MLQIDKEKVTRIKKYLFVLYNNLTLRSKKLITYQVFTTIYIAMNQNENKCSSFQHITYCLL